MIKKVPRTKITKLSPDLLYEGHSESSYHGVIALQWVDKTLSSNTFDLDMMFVCFVVFFSLGKKVLGVLVRSNE